MCRSDRTRSRMVSWLFTPASSFSAMRTGYQVRIALKELAGVNNQLTILLRVRSERHMDEPVYFVQKFRVPPIEEDTTGSTVLQGFFRLGEGKYHVDWLIRDLNERGCSR